MVEVEKIEKPQAEWKKQLIAGTIRGDAPGRHGAPGTGKYANNHADGLYHCICCNTVLFDSKTKFESGTGWPSFWQPIAKENVTVAGGQLARDAKRRGAVHPVRRSSGARL